jgi:hypothetical protein
MSENLFRNFKLLVCCGLLHQLSVTEISDDFCHSVAPKQLQNLLNTTARELGIFVNILQRFV